ncbi:MAG: UTRA domain-containing protein, partial [Gammaproteobacteria bacterium]|nr:UTRA domain-containing protein [Gammaproteobacteria bacterium]
VLSLESVYASPTVTELMQLAEEATLYRLRAVHYQDDLPLQLESRYVNPAAMPDFIHQDFTRMTSTAYLLQQFKPDEMEHRVRAILPDQQTRELLTMAQGQPCLQLTRRTWKDDQVVTYVTLTYPGDRYELGARYATDEYQLR